MAASWASTYWKSVCMAVVSCLIALRICWPIVLGNMSLNSSLTPKPMRPATGSTPSSNPFSAVFSASLPNVSSVWLSTILLVFSVARSAVTSSELPASENALDRSSANKDSFALVAFAPLIFRGVYAAAPTRVPTAWAAISASSACSLF